MDEFLQLIGTISQDDADNISIFLESAGWCKASLKARMKLDLADGTSQIWEVSCGHVLRHRLELGFAGSLEFTDDHPLLWEFQQPIGSAFFQGIPVNAEAAAGALYEAHEKEAGPWVPFHNCLNDFLPLSNLLLSGNGLLAEGPSRLLNAYREVLSRYGTQIYFRFRHVPQNAGAIRLLLLGHSYVIGDCWNAERLRA